MAMQVCVTALLLVFVPSVAHAADPVAHSTVARRVSGVQIAQQILGQLTSVQLGSGDATVTIHVGGRTRPVRIDYSTLVGAAGPVGGATGAGGIGGLTRLFAIPVAGGVFLKLASVLSRLRGRA